MRLLRAAVVLVPLAVLLSAASCSSQKALCDKICDCQGCSDSELESCYDQAERDELAAEQEDCLSEYGDLVACGNDAFECVNDRADFGDECTSEGLAYLGCVGEDQND